MGSSLRAVVALRRYVVAFGLRCACAAFVFLLASQSTTIAAERAANVILGGATGIAFVLLTRAIAGVIRPIRTSGDTVATPSDICSNRTVGDF